MSSIRCIPAASLRTGMYLHKIGGSWLSHPFLRNSFLLVDPEDVRRIIEAGIDSVWIDDDAQLEARYGARVPVLRDGDRELDWPFDAGALAAFLRG